MWLGMTILVNSMSEDPTPGLYFEKGSLIWGLGRSKKQVRGSSLIATPFLLSEAIDEWPVALRNGGSAAVAG